MKLRNKKTGEIVDVESIGHADSLKGKFGYQVTLSWKIDEHLCTCKTYNSLAELNEEWEDYEEPKEWWFIDCTGSIKHGDGLFTEKSYIEGIKEIGNYFETEEEAEKAVEKLKAWKRLKDNGFKVETYGYDRETVKNGRVNIMIRCSFNEKYGEGSVKLTDLDLLFGGEE